jgi:hypothetical protein
LTAPFPPVNGQFSQAVVAGSSITGRAVVGYQTFVLAAMVNGSNLGGVINVSGGPLVSWSPAVATIHGTRSPWRVRSVRKTAPDLEMERHFKASVAVGTPRLPKTGSSRGTHLHPEAGV